MAPLPQIVFISSIDWGAAWQRHQIFARQFALAGHEVFFIENSGFRNPAWADCSRLRKKALEFATGADSRPPGDGAPRGVRVFPPRVFPPTLRTFRLFNRHLFLPNLVERLTAAGLRPHPLVIVYFPTATSLDLLSLLEPSAVVYDCASNFRAHPSAPGDFPELERALLSRADLVVCDSDYLFNEKKGEHPDVAQIHQGVADDFFDVKPGRSPIRSFCYYGTWGPDLAPEYLQALLDAGFQVTMSGFFKGKHAELPAGVTRLAPTAPDKLRERLEGFDAFLMPYRVTPFHLGVVPAKIYECLAMGRPVLATPLPSLAPYKDLIHIADKPGDWARIARDLSKTETEALRRSRVERAREHTYAKEFGRLQERIRAAQGRRAANTHSAAPPAALPRQVRAFVKGFSLIGLFYGLAKVSILATQVVAGRLLGPLEYGKANLVLAVSAFLQILPMMGLPVALSKFLSAEPSEEKRRAIISTGYAAFLVWGALVLAACLLLRHAVAAWLAVPLGLFHLALFYSLCNASYVVLSSPLLGLRRFSERGAAETLYGLSAPVLFLLLGASDHGRLIAALSLSFALGSSYSIRRLRGYLSLQFHPQVFRSLSRYSLEAAINLLTLACVLAPARLLLNRHFDPHEVGVFSAYFTATAQVSLSLLYMLTAVLIPVSSDAEGQAQAWSAFRRIRLPLTVGAWLGLTAVACAALFMFGKRYEFRLDWAAAFAAAAALIMTHGIATNIFAARDLSGLRVSVLGSIAAGAGNLLLCLVLVPRWGITGAAVSLLGAYGLGLAYYAFFGIEGTFMRRAGIPS
ncbi:MAG: oligosaccharide flippase family protein [Elusimicrobia bacterium]|nr:oligosaccharide flippase family protein [Elusimicrobiota bacterium]